MHALIIQKEQADFDQSAVELLALSRGSLGSVIEPSGLYLETSNLDTIGASANPPAAKVPEKLMLEEVSDFEDSDDSGPYVDPLKAVKSPTKVTSECSTDQVEKHSVFENPESPSFGNIDSPDSLLGAPASRVSPHWSTQNQFFPLGCQLTP